MAAGDHTVTGTMTANKVAVTDTAVVANLNADKMDGAEKDIDGTLAGNSDWSIPSEKAVKTYVDAHKNTETAGVHGSASAATASKLMHRDAAGRAKVVAPAAATDIALKSTVTDDIATHAALAVEGTHGSTVAATANKLVHRDAAGRAKVVNPAAAQDIATKTYVDTADALKADDDAVVHDTGNETVAGIKTFSSAPVLSAGAKIGSDGPTLRCKVIEIGDWNMDTGVTKNVAHGIGASFKNIRIIRTIIRNDADTHYYPLERVASVADPTLLAGGINDIDVGNITLLKRAGGFFDSADFDSTTYNRGWVTIWYEV